MRDGRLNVLLVCPADWRPGESLRATLSEFFTVRTADTDMAAELLLHDRAFHVVVVHQGLAIGGLALLSAASVIRPAATLCWLVTDPRRVRDVLQDSGPFSAILDVEADPETLLAEIVRATKQSERRESCATTPFLFCEDGGRQGGNDDGQA